MGTWASGTFDNDASRDFADSLAGNVRAEIQYDGCEAEDLELLLAAVAILTTLCEHCHANVPEPEVVQGWREAHLRAFDAKFDSLEPSEQHKRAVRANTIEVFARLEALSRKFQTRRSPFANSSPSVDDKPLG